MQDIVVITGASSGIGEAIGISLQNKGYHVVNISMEHSKFDDILCDISDTHALNYAIDCFYQFLDSVDKNGIYYLINNAGIMPLEPDSVSLYNKVMNTNLRSMYQLSNRLVDDIEHGIINIASVSALGPASPDDNIAYGISKAGVVTLTKYLAIKYPRLCINAISPGFISPTNLCGPSPTPQDLNDTVPKKRVGNVTEIADLVNYLMSQTYMTGQNIVFDGGLSLV